MCIVLYLEKSGKKLSQSVVILFLFNLSIILFNLILDMLRSDLSHPLVYYQVIVNGLT